MSTVKQNRTYNIRKLINQHGGVVKFANITGYTQSQVSQWKSEKNPKSVGDAIARKIEEATNLPAGYLDFQHDFETVKSKMLPVPLMKFKVCASSGIEAWTEEIETVLSIPEIVAQRKKINTKNLICIEVSGECMSPTYNSGDFVFVDRSYSDPSTMINNRTYVVKYNSELSLKRLEKFPNYMLMKSDNPNKIIFRDREVSFSDINEGKVNFEIVGLVVYSMGD